MKNIGLLISELNSGGAERVVSRLSKILCNDYNIYLIVFEDTYISYDYSGTLVNMDIPAKPGKLAKISLLKMRIDKAKKLKKELKLDIVISFLDSPNIVNILSRVSGCKTAVSIRNYSALENKSSVLGKITNLLYRLLYNKADMIVPVTKVIEDSYIREYGINKHKLKVIYNPYDLEELEVLAGQQSAFDFSLVEGKIVIVTVGRQMYQKGYWHLIKAFSQIHERYDNTALIMVGQEAADGQVRNLVNRLGLNNAVYLVGRQSNPFSIMARADIYVLTSLFEGFPNAMVEAMACGLPIIAADCKSGPREILAPGTGIDAVCGAVEKAEYGILTCPLEEEEIWEGSTLTRAEKHLVNAMSLMINDDQLRNDYAAKAKYRAKDFNYETCKKLYKEVIEYK